MTVSLAIVDDNPGNRSILKSKIAGDPRFEMRLVAGDGKDFLESMKALPKHLLPQIVLMDLEMPVMDGVDAIAIGSVLYPDTRFVVLTIFDDEEKIFHAIRAGAYGYLLKDETAEKICDVLWQMQDSGVGPISPGIAHKILQWVQVKGIAAAAAPPAAATDVFALTNREREILELLVQGLLYKEIGARLGLSPNTAKKHVLNIYAKLHVNNRAQATLLVHKEGTFKF